jgi:hypothetical protein
MPVGAELELATPDLSPASSRTIARGRRLLSTMTTTTMPIFVSRCDKRSSSASARVSRRVEARRIAPRLVTYVKRSPFPNLSLLRLETGTPRQGLLPVLLLVRQAPISTEERQPRVCTPRTRHRHPQLLRLETSVRLDSFALSSSSQLTFQMFRPAVRLLLPRRRYVAGSVPANSALIKLAFSQTTTESPVEIKPKSVKRTPA